mmetsp:Transcript_41585/g.82043  ORF Transcript_41585/g.82043 Transcript_41585/m.82043 type:complete len:88 (+) Transcript_41585:230-493(+)
MQKRKKGNLSLVLKIERDSADLTPFKSATPMQDMKTSETVNERRSGLTLKDAGKKGMPFLHASADVSMNSWRADAIRHERTNESMHE